MSFKISDLRLQLHPQGPMSWDPIIWLSGQKFFRTSYIHFQEIVYVSVVSAGASYLGPERDFSRWRHDIDALATLLALCEGNAAVILWFPLQRAIDAKTVSISRRHIRHYFQEVGCDMNVENLVKIKWDRIVDCLYFCPNLIFLMGICAFMNYYLMLPINYSWDTATEEPWNSHW